MSLVLSNQKGQVSLWADSLALLGLYLFSCFAWFPDSDALVTLEKLPDFEAILGLTAVAIACFIDGRRVHGGLRERPLFWLTAGIVAYLLIHGVSTILEQGPIGGFRNRLAYTGIVLITFACILDAGRVWSVARRSPLIWLSVISIVYILLRATGAVQTDPGSAHYHWNDALTLSALCLFPIVAWSVGARQHRILIALGLALFGFVFARLEDLGTEWMGDEGWRILVQWLYSRDPMGLGSVIALGQYSSAAALGVVLMTPRVWNSINTESLRWIVIFLWLILALFLMELVVMSQSRGAWIALAAVTMAIIVSEWMQPTSKKRRADLFLLTLVIIMMAVLGYLNRELITSRVTQESGTIKQVIKGDFGEVSARNKDGGVRSVGVRVHMMRFGVDSWRENPVFGYGPGATPLLLREKEEVSMGIYTDMHNIYLETLLRLGLVGAGLLLAGLCLIGYSAWRACREGFLDRDVFLVLAGAIALHLLVGFINFRMLDQDWRFYWWLFGGAMASFAIFPGLKRSSESTAPN